MRTLLKALFISSTALLTAVACAPSSTSNSKADSQPGFFEMKVPREEANAIIAQTQLLCDGACPPALAIALTRVDRSKTSTLHQCTAFLISDDIVATNAHCVPDDLHRPGASARGRMTFFFGTPAEAVSGQLVLAVSQEAKTNLQPDMALIRLDRALKRAPLKLSRGGLANDEKLVAYSVDPVVVNKRSVGRLRVHECVAKQGSLLTPQFTNDFGSVAALACEMKLGNSGSPVVAADGTVRAVLHGFRTGTSRAYKGFQMPARFNSLAYATNVACVDSPTLESDPPSACLAPPLKREEFLMRMESSVTVDLDQPFAEWTRSEAPRLFTFVNEDISSNGHKAAIPKLRCVSRLATWLEKPASELGLQSLTRKSNQVSLSFSIPVWGVQPALDESERVSMGLGEIDRANTTLTFDLEAARRNGFIRFTKTFTSETGRLVVKPATVDLPYCP